MKVNKSYDIPWYFLGQITLFRSVSSNYKVLLAFRDFVPWQMKFFCLLLYHFAFRRHQQIFCHHQTKGDFFSISHILIGKEGGIPLLVCLVPCSQTVGYSLNTSWLPKPKLKTCKHIFPSENSANTLSKWSNPVVHECKHLGFSLLRLQVWSFDQYNRAPWSTRWCN
jgi:hypothetical protein